MIKDGQVVIVDEFTGRLMPGRRWSDGLHQAVEAKEKVKIERENQTLATITFQNYFRKYKKLSGMTGTADTEAEEFAKIYKLDVNVIPTNRRVAAHRRARHGLPHRAREVRVDRHRHHREAGRPAGRRWSARSRSRSPSGCPRMLKKRGIKHVVLNAKYHAQEAEIVAQAGRKGAVTIATNMAGRGTDILLGGNAEFMARQQSLAEEVAERLTQGTGEVRRRRRVRLLLPHRQLLSRAAGGLGAHLQLLQAAVRGRARRGRRGSAAFTSSAPSVTRRAASTTSCAAAPAVRAIPARHASTCRSKTT